MSPTNSFHRSIEVLIFVFKYIWTIWLIIFPDKLTPFNPANYSLYQRYCCSRLFILASLCLLLAVKRFSKTKKQTVVLISTVQNFLEKYRLLFCIFIILSKLITFLIFSNVFIKHTRHIFDFATNSILIPVFFSAILLYFWNKYRRESKFFCFFEYVDPLY
jgi:hypothetical protein